MNFPLNLTAHIQAHEGHFVRNITLHKGLTVLIGPNGSGKTHILRGLKGTLSHQTFMANKRVRFLSAGRIGLLEQYRSDVQGYGHSPEYESANFGSKSDSNRRHQTETLNGDFQTLAVRSDIQIKIQERLRKLFKRDLIIEWDGGVLKTSFSRVKVDSKPYSAGREASGLMHLVGILSALYDDDVGALLLDEPEVSLHPQLQAFLLNEILTVAGHPSEGTNKKIVIIATHSTEMLKISCTDDLLSLVFCDDLENQPIQISPDAAELKSRKLQSLIPRLGQEHKLALFSKRPLLVEGPSDTIIVSALANKLQLHLEAAGSQLLPVIGTGQMPIVSKLFKMFGKEPVALADADGIADGVELMNSYLGSNTYADSQASEKGFASAQQMANTIYNDFCKLVSARWSEIAHSAEAHPYWINRKPTEEEQAKRRAALSTLFVLEEVALASLSADQAWSRIRNRLTALLDLLERCGLYILRRGSIESYYLTSDRFTSLEKPSAAIEEIEGFDRAAPSDIESGYADVIRCIRSASGAELISEADALRDLLLSITAPAHAKFKEGNSSENYNLLSRTIIGERSKIFRIEIKDDKLAINIESKILNVTGFPIEIGKDDDVLKSINNALGTGAHV
jgi:energy-coupling factor transporter ATP-binding protein EcfA2